MLINDVWMDSVLHRSCLGSERGYVGYGMRVLWNYCNGRYGELGVRAITIYCWSFQTRSTAIGCTLVAVMGLPQGLTRVRDLIRGLTCDL